MIVKDGLTGKIFESSYDAVKEAEKAFSENILEQKAMTYKEYVDKYINPNLPEGRKIETDPSKTKGWSNKQNLDEQINFNASFPIKFTIVD